MFDLLLLLLLLLLLFVATASNCALRFLKDVGAACVCLLLLLGVPSGPTCGLLVFESSASACLAQSASRLSVGLATACPLARGSPESGSLSSSVLAAADGART